MPFRVQIWVSPRDCRIRIAAKGEFISTISNDPTSKRYHPHLYGKLKAALKRRGKWPAGC